MRNRAAEKEQRQRDDLAEAGRVGAEFSLGAVEAVTRLNVRFGNLQVAIGVNLVILALLMGPIFAFSPNAQPTPRLIIVSLSVCGLVLGCWLTRSGLRPRAVNRVFRYRDGVLMLVHDEPEPRVVRWADVESVTIWFNSVSDDSNTGLDVCTLRDGTGAEVTVRGFAGRRWRLVARDLTAAVGQALSPRIAPLLIQAYEAGDPLTAGDARIDQSGVTVGRRAVLIPWAEVQGLTIEYDTWSAAGCPAQLIRIVRLAGRRPARAAIRLSGVPNGMFVPRLIEHVAGRHGIPLSRSGPVPPGLPR